MAKIFREEQRLELLLLMATRSFTFAVVSVSSYSVIMELPFSFLRSSSVLQGRDHGRTDGDDSEPMSEEGDSEDEDDLEGGSRSFTVTGVVPGAASGSAAPLKQPKVHASHRS